MVITIDGPTASGKSTVAVQLARTLHYYYLNTGFLYRGISYLLLSKYGYTLPELAHPKESDIHEILDPSRFKYYTYHDKAGVMYDDVIITPFLKSKENDQASSIVSGNQMVRNALLAYQRHYTKSYNVIAEGRDTGTIIFPDAEIKIFLTASLEERARRWQQQQAAQGNCYSFDESIAQVQERDERDSTRTIAPLRVPSGATVFDNTNLTKEQTVTALIDIIKANAQ